MSALDFIGRGLLAQRTRTAERWERLAALRQLRLLDPPRFMAVPPLISLKTGSTDIASGTTIPRGDRRITYSGGTPMTGTGGSPYDTVYYNRWITQPGGANRGEHDWSQRFVTDAPQFEIVFGDWNGASSVTVMVDGEIVSRRAQIALPNAGNYQYVKVDFGVDIQGIHVNATVASGGAGYALGDELTVIGGTANGRPMVLTVSGVDGSGAVTRFYVRESGAYTVVAGSGAGVTGGAGSGATFNVTAGTPDRSTHTTRRMRRIEVLGRGTKINGLRVPNHSVVRPWPVAGPRFLFMTDSYGDTFTDAPCGGWPYRLAQRFGIEDVWVNGQGGTGFLADNSGALSRYRNRLGDFAARMPANPLTPMVLVTQASINDSAPTDAALQAEVQAYWDQFFATPAYANTFAIQTGIMRSQGATPADSKNAAVKAGFLASQAVFDPLGLRTAFIDLRGTGHDLLTIGGKAGATTGAGNTDFWDSGDGAHLTQAGQDFVGDMLAAEVLRTIQTWT